MKRVITVCILLAGLSGCVATGLVGAGAVAKIVGGIGTVSIVTANALADYCATSTNAEAKAAAGCGLIEE